MRITGICMRAWWVGLASGVLAGLSFAQTAGADGLCNHTREDFHAGRSRRSKMERC